MVILVLILLLVVGVVLIINKMGKKSPAWRDFSTFRRMISPAIIQVVFWIGVVACIIGGIGLIVAGADGNEDGLIAIGIALIPVGPVVVRLWCELLILFFRINETLTEIKNEISKPSE